MKNKNIFELTVILAVIAIVGVYFYENSQNNYIKIEELISKYPTKVEKNDEEAIKQSILSTNYANVIIELDDNKNMDEVSFEMPQLEFKREESNIYFVGNTSLTGLKKLLQNQHVIRIYYNFHVSP